jgi:hypothetical protein
MQERYVRDGFALLAVEDRATGEFLGNVGPLVQTVDQVDEIELGWSITPCGPGRALPPKRPWPRESGYSRHFPSTT